MSAANESPSSTTPSFGSPDERFAKANERAPKPLLPKSRLAKANARRFANANALRFSINWVESSDEAYK